jgi:ribosomal protein S18 acetylase RimI-like enzyme
MTEFRPVEDRDIETLVALWDACDLSRPWNPASDDIANLRAHPMADILVAVDQGAVIASIAVGYDGHRGWAYYVATDPARRRDGLGRQAVTAAETWARTRGIVKLMLMVRDTNAAVAGFYGALGYEDAGVRVLQKWLSPERASLYAAGHHV